MKAKMFWLVSVFWLLLVANASAFYDPGLQRWINRDPIGEEGGINLFSYVENDPANLFDAFGLEGDYPGGHHYVVRELWKNWESCPGRDVFKNATLNPVNAEHQWSPDHFKYNQEVLTEWIAFKKENGLKGRARPNDQQAKEFIERIKTSPKPAIRDFIKKITPRPKVPKPPLPPKITPGMRGPGIIPKIRCIGPSFPDLDVFQFYEYRNGQWRLIT